MIRVSERKGEQDCMWLLKRVGQFAACNRHTYSTLGALLLLVGIFGFLLPTLEAQAATSSCRGDPIVTFTNGLQLALSVSLDNDGSSVSQVVYTLHAPAGWSVKQVQYTGGPLQHKESFVFYNDESSYRFDAYTLVNASVSTTVTTQTLLTGHVQYTDTNGHPATYNLNQSNTASGTNGQQISTPLSW
jgi:hypothetical protein